MIPAFLCGYNASHYDPKFYYVFSRSHPSLFWRSMYYIKYYINKFNVWLRPM